MGNIISSYMFPHPPIIVPEIGKGEEKDAMSTVNACKKAAQDIAREKPATIIVTTPHAVMFKDYVYMSVNEVLSGDFGRFGSKNVRLEFQNDMDLVNSIIRHAKSENIFCGGLDEELKRKYDISQHLDHGALVPLYFINKDYSDFKLVHISTAWLSFMELYRFGMCIARAVEESNERVVFVASGDMSHRLSSDTQYGYSQFGKEFDQILIKSVRDTDVERLLELDEGFCEEAGECGLRSFLMMYGALDGYDVKPEVYSYEGPYGVGYSVARIVVGQKNPEREILGKFTQKIKALRQEESEYVALARKALETYVKEDRIIPVPEAVDSEMLKNKAGTFVSIKKNGELRGCIGTIGPTRKNIAEEIIYNAISSGTRDPRFDPVEPYELDQLVYSVDVLRKAEPIRSVDELDTVKYGVIVRSGGRSGLLLPNLEGVDTPEEQVSIALQKAGIRPGENYDMERFEVVRYK